MASKDPKMRKLLARGNMEH